MPTSEAYDRFLTPPPLPAAIALAGSPTDLGPQRRLVGTETSASAGWAARLALRFPGKPASSPPPGPRSAPAPRRARLLSACS